MSNGIGTATILELMSRHLFRRRWINAVNSSMLRESFSNLTPGGMATSTGSTNANNRKEKEGSKDGEGSGHQNGTSPSSISGIINEDSSPEDDARYYDSKEKEERMSEDEKKSHLKQAGCSDASINIDDRELTNSHGGQEEEEQSSRLATIQNKDRARNLVGDTNKYSEGIGSDDGS